ncbi:hypothetical protein SLS60_003668 [Paraconiothyrium brasiliense]|uniref:Protein kinase domain-containing protein n=1 Tax=Paraconiothyrium brasiliense TaxID=300254 RepID=A0ABR3RPC0_9PLEO
MSHDEAARMTALFREQLRQYTITPDEGEGQPYVRTDDLVNWMTNTTGAQEPIAKRLLDEAYRSPSSQRSSEFFIPYNTICREPQHRDRCIIAFSILLEIGLGHLIHDVQQEDIVDQILPMTPRLLEEKFRRIAERQGSGFADQGLNIANRFNEAQWKYFPVTFTLGMDKNFSEQRVFPICRKREIGRGGQARVFQILVQDNYIAPELRSRLSNDEHTCIEDEKFGTCFQLALKTFESAQSSYWANEKQAFMVLQQQRNKGMIQCLGYYAILRGATTDSHRYSSTSQFREMNILLEYGRFDLMGIFESRLPPVNSPEIEEFWRSLIEVVDALKGIHDFRTQNGRYHGWHNDIKPENIIVVNERYKLADPGFAKFKKTLEEKDGQSFPKIIADGGTATYAAPERYARKSDSRVLVSQSVDLWSIGCIFSMAATWIVLGYQGIRQFDCIRQRAIRDIGQRARDGHNEPRVAEGDFFHDGIDVLPVVKEWHKYLRASVRQTDHVTRKVLDLTEDHLLIRNRKMSAKKLYLELQELLKTCTKENIPEGLETLMDMLLDLDEGANSVPATVASQNNVINVDPALRNQSRNGMSRLEVPGQLLKTASRFESLSKLSTARLVKVPTNEDRTPAQNDRLSNVPEAISQRVLEQNGRNRPVSMPPDLTLQRTPTYRSVRTDNGKTPDPINVIQAHEQLSGRSLMDFLSKKEDEFVKKYFGNRDIKFLVDNSSSMIPYWAEAIYLLETLVLMAKRSDKDGMDLYFTIPDQRKSRDRPFQATLQGAKSESQFRKAMEEKDPKKGLWTDTDMIAPIENIFDEFLNPSEDLKQLKSIMKRPKKTQGGSKALTLLILTNGTWGAMDPDAINGCIEKLLKDLSERGLIGNSKKGFDRHVSIEFIQFGDDPTVTERLRALDDGMEIKGYE